MNKLSKNKLEILKLINNKKQIKDIIKQYNIPKSTLYYWIKQDKKDK